MDADERHRFVTMIDMALRDTTSPEERAAAISRIMAVAGAQTVADVLKAEFTAEAEPVPVSDVTPALRQLIKLHGIVRVRRVLGEIDAGDGLSSMRERPWHEWKAKHLETVAECERLRRRVAVLESERYAKYRVTPDAEGYIPFHTFLVGLLAARDWEIRLAHKEFAELAGVSQQDVVDWRKRGKVPHYYYKMLDKLPFGGISESENLSWNEEEVAMLLEYYGQKSVLPDGEIAAEMSRRLGRRVSGRAVHSKAHKLGLLTNVTRAGRRLKAARRNPRAAGGSAQHSPH
jgi:hypothetical protein